MTHESRRAKIRRARAALWLQRLLLLVGVLCLGYYSYATAEAYLYQEWENRQLDAILAGVPQDGARSGAGEVTGGAPVPRAPRSAPAAGAVLGRLEIPRLGVSTIVRAGSDARTLDLAIGHIAGTALPGEAGNVGLAGHRDTFFRRLERIRPDDEIRFVTPEGTHVYRVERTDVVTPQDVWVLDSDGAPVLTLVTCYPFTYVGPAPDRFIVRALLDGAGGV